MICHFEVTERYSSVFPWRLQCDSIRMTAGHGAADAPAGPICRAVIVGRSKGECGYGTILPAAVPLRIAEELPICLLRNRRLMELDWLLSIPGSRRMPTGFGTDTRTTDGCVHNWRPMAASLDPSVRAIGFSGSTGEW